MSDIHVDGVETWVPLDLDAGSEEVARGLVERFGDDDVTATIAAGLGGVALRLGQQDGPEDPPTLAAWVRTLGADELTPLEVAALRVHPFDGLDASRFLEQYVAGAELYTSVETSELDTASGPATTARFRTVEVNGADREIHEHNLVTWIRPDLRCAVVLAALSTDLVSAATLPDALHQLAEGVHGL